MTGARVTSLKSVAAVDALVVASVTWFTDSVKKIS